MEAPAVESRLTASENTIGPRTQTEASEKTLRGRTRPAICLSSHECYSVRISDTCDIYSSLV